MHSCIGNNVSQSGLRTTGKHSLLLFLSLSRSYGKYRRKSDAISMASMGEATSSQQPLALEADMALAADDDVVVDRDAERARGLDDLACHVDVGAARRRVA